MSRVLTKFRSGVESIVGSNAGRSFRKTEGFRLWIVETVDIYRLHPIL
jgi:hypothetical protein